MKPFPLFTLIGELQARGVEQAFIDSVFNGYDQWKASHPAVGVDWSYGIDWTAVSETKGVENVALNIKDPILAATKKKVLGVDYGEHVGDATVQKSMTKPIVGSAMTSKAVKGVTTETAQGETETLHPGVVGSGMQITVGGGRTLNLGNYESARVDVSITVPCEKETLGEAYDYACAWVDEKITENVKQAKGEG